MIVDALLLPALSSISTRDEMLPLAEQLQDRLRFIVPDWPGFGARPRGAEPVSPTALRAFLDDQLRALTPGSIGIAAGHAATYLAEAARRHPGRLARLILIAPTWRGPFPTMTRGQRPWLCSAIRAAMEAPVLGQALYRLNLSDPVIGRMLRAHVYADPANVTPALLAAKRVVAHQPRARFVTAAFVSGGLDPVASRDAFLALFTAGLPPTLLLRPVHAPAKSGAEMDALATLTGITVMRIPGALAAHEEHPAETAAAIRDYLSKADQVPQNVESTS